jgi:hypothetical protein
VIKFGLISDTDRKGLVKVNFDEDQIVSGWLPVVVPSSIGIQYYTDLALNTRVACLMDQYCEDGVVLGAIYDAQNKAAGAEGVTSIAIGATVYEISDQGFKIKRAEETLKKLLSDILDEIKNITVNTPSGVSATPNNVLAFDAIIERLDNLMPE